MISLFAKDDKQREALANRLLTPSTFGNIVNKFKMVGSFSTCSDQAMQCNASHKKCLFR